MTVRAEIILLGSYLVLLSFVIVQGCAPKPKATQIAQPVEGGIPTINTLINPDTFPVDTAAASTAVAFPPNIGQAESTGATAAFSDFLAVTTSVASVGSPAGRRGLPPSLVADTTVAQSPSPGFPRGNVPGRGLPPVLPRGVTTQQGTPRGLPEVVTTTQGPPRRFPEVVTTGQGPPPGRATTEQGPQPVGITSGQGPQPGGAVPGQSPPPGGAISGQGPPPGQGLTPGVQDSITSPSTLNTAAANGPPTRRVEPGGPPVVAASRQPTVLRDPCAGDGVTIGGRCFYVLNSSYSWTDAWGACRRQGGVVAQIMTSGELSTISVYLTDRLRNGNTASVWIALRKSGSNATQVGFMPPNSTYWYDSSVQPNLRLSAANTWIRNRENDDDETIGGECIQLWANYSQFGDNACSARVTPLCEVASNTSTDQFTLVSNTCLNEKPVEEVRNPNGASVCTNVCRSRLWCRSYNLVNGSDCQLFPWVPADEPATISSTEQACQYFQYVP